MDDFNLLELFLSDHDDHKNETVLREAHELMDSEREPHLEEYETNTSLIGRVLYSPFVNDSYTTYY